MKGGKKKSTHTDRFQESLQYFIKMWLGYNN